MNKFLIILSLIALCLLGGCTKKKDNTELLKQFRELKYKDDDLAKTLLYRLYIPEGYDPKNKYPFILYLHDGGGNGSDNTTQIGIVAEQIISNTWQDVAKALVMVPQCPKGEQWVNTKFKRLPYTNYDQNDIPESDSLIMIIKAMNELQEQFSIDKRRLYITGYSMGGSGTWDMITRYPDLFAAAVPVTGVSDPSKAKKVHKLPIWAFHGQNDHVSLVDNTRNMIREIKKYGSNCKYTEYENVKHDSWRKAYSETEMLNWLFSKEKND